MSDIVERLRDGVDLQAAAEIEHLRERIIFLTQRIGQLEALFGETYGRNNSSLSSGKGADASARPPPWASD